MERPHRTFWQKHLRPQDRAAMVIVLTLTIAIVTLLVLVLF